MCRVQSNGGDGFTTITNNVTNFNDLGKGKIRKFFALRRELQQAQTIVIHGFMFPLPWLLFLYFHRHFLRKAVWIIWGVDLYNYHREHGNWLKNKIINYMEDEVRKAVKTPVTIFPTDEPAYRHIFGEDGKLVICAPLGTPDSVFDEWDVLLRHRQEIYDKYFNGNSNDPRREKSIQVGHNAFKFNKHGEILTLLERFKREKIKITLPMSYGNDYGDTSNTYVKNIQGLIRNFSMEEKCRILTKLMPKSKYFEFLAAVDVAILNADRQNALGNILPLLYMGKKIYLSQDNPLYHFFINEGFEIHNTNELAHITFEEFIEPIHKPFPDPWIRTFYSFKYCSRKWKVVFGYTEGAYTKEDALKKLKDIENDLNSELQEKRILMNIELQKKNAMREERAVDDEAKKKEQEIYDINVQEYAAIASWLEKRHIEDMEKNMMLIERKNKEERLRQETIMKLIRRRTISRPTSVEIHNGHASMGTQRYLLVYDRKNRGTGK